MKIRNIFVSFATMAITLVSCGPATSTQHGLSVVYPANSYQELYADQTADSICFFTYDSFKTLSYGADWITILNTKNNPSEGTIANKSILYYVPVKLQFQPNTTGKARLGAVRVYSYADDWNSEQDGRVIGGNYVQLGWHKVNKPAPVYYEVANEQFKSCKFESIDSMTQTADTLRFMAYDAWTLEEADGSFVKCAKTSGNAGTQIVLLTVEPNATGSERSTQLKLKSANGVTTTITYKQKGAK